MIAEILAEILSDNKEVLAVIAVPTIGVIGTVLVTWLKLDRRNSRQHEQSYGLLQSIDTRLDGHGTALGRLEAHAEQANSRLDALTGRVERIEDRNEGDGK